MLSGGLEGSYDAVIVILGIGGDFGMPDHFFGVDGLSVHYGGHLSVGTAGIKADAAAVQIAADGFGDLVGSGAIFQRQVNDLQIPLIELVEERKVKMPLALGVVGFFSRWASSLHPQTLTRKPPMDHSRNLT